MEAPLFLNAKEASKILNISVNSLYTYVSRKGIRTKLATDRKARLYWAEDIFRLANKDISTPSGSDSSLVPQTAITLITSAGPFYRGHSAVALSQTSTLEEVAAILWQADRNELFGDRLPHLPFALSALRDELPSPDRAHSYFPAIERANPRSYDLTQEGFARTGADILRCFAAIMTGASVLSVRPVHEQLADRFAPRPEYADILRRALVLFADHELAPATYAVRAAANTGATPYQLVLIGLDTMRGRRLQLGRGDNIRRFINEILDAPDPATPVVKRYRNGEQLPGFADGIYAGEDSRARALLSAWSMTMPDDDAQVRLSRAIEVGQELTGAVPDFALPLFLLEKQLGLQNDDGSLMGIARLVGWIAHAWEQFSSTPLIRPRTAYVGELPDADEEGAAGRVRR